MKHNDAFSNFALRLMEHRLAQLRSQPSLTEEEKSLASELATWVESKHARQCDECCGVGMVRFAYTGIIGKTSFLVGRADEDQAGHAPQPKFGSFSTLKEAQEQADILNATIGLDKKAACEIVVSSIRAQNVRERASTPRDR